VIRIRVVQDEIVLDRLGSGEQHLVVRRRRDLLGLPGQRTSTRMLGAGLNPGRRQHSQVVAAAAAVQADVVAAGVADRLSSGRTTSILSWNVVAVEASRVERLVGVMNDVTRRGHQVTRLSSCRRSRG